MDTYEHRSGNGLVSLALIRDIAGDRRLLWIAVYAVAMAYIEATVVVYLRGLYGIQDLVRDVPTSVDAFTSIEVGREAATLVMLLAVGWVAGRRWSSALAYAAYAFGIWDIWYYVWLRVLVQWPASILDWDVLFLIPVQWWGPVLAPVLIAALMAAAGGIIAYRVERGDSFRWRWTGFGLLCLGAAVDFYTFIADALAALPGGWETLLHVKPSTFPWPLFLFGYGCMLLGTAMLVRWEPALRPEPDAAI